MHCAVISPDNRFVLACNLGEDAIEIFRIHPGAARPMEAPVRLRRGLDRGLAILRSIRMVCGCTAFMSLTARLICMTGT